MKNKKKQNKTEQIKAKESKTNQTNKISIYKQNINDKILKNTQTIAKN